MGTTKQRWELLNKGGIGFRISVFSARSVADSCCGCMQTRGAEHPCCGSMLRVR